MVQENSNKAVKAPGEFVLERDNDGLDHEDLATLSSTRLKQLALLLKNNPKVTIIYKTSRYNTRGNYIETVTSKQSLATLLDSVLVMSSDDDRGTTSDKGATARIALENLLKAGVGGRQDFLDLKPLHRALWERNIKVVKILSKDPSFRAALKKEANRTDPSYRATELRLAIALDDVERLNSAPELLALKESKDFKPRDLIHYLEEAWEYDSQKVAQEIENIYFQPVKDELAKYFTKELENKKIITTQDTDKMKKGVIELLSSVSFKEDKSDVKEVAGAIVREAAIISNTPLDWKTRLFKIKDVIKDHLPKIFLNTKAQKIKQILKDEELQKTLTEMHNLKKNKTNTAQAAPSLTSYKKLPER
ncbi:hypothetical protein [Candidatus Tisiphia endosymbiont of Nemotelus uliginosus]|uniref:hypothetical protein n=1 Tax=Candidatus Tisiphia endosymbiont of Nemotelus uliginosus TaxID=3077926 RepID=UPI0035C8D781